MYISMISPTISKDRCRVHTGGPFTSLRCTTWPGGTTQKDRDTVTKP